MSQQEQEFERVLRWVLVSAGVIIALAASLSLFNYNALLPAETAPDSVQEITPPVQSAPAEDVYVARNTSQNKTINFTYVVKGVRGTISLTLNGELRDYLASRSRSVWCDPNCPSTLEQELKYVNEQNSEPVLNELADKIKNLTPYTDDQVRIAVSLVQNIPYDSAGLETDTLNNRYPYEVLYDRLGVCGEKSHLLVALLKKLGYGSALLLYRAENHEAVGIPCPAQYQYARTPGYCFIETTNPAIITDYDGNYTGVGKLRSYPEVYATSFGKSFDSVKPEYMDHAMMQSLGSTSDWHGGLTRREYRIWAAIVKDYGLLIDEEAVVNRSLYTFPESGPTPSNYTTPDAIQKTGDLKINLINIFAVKQGMWGEVQHIKISVDNLRNESVSGVVNFAFLNQQGIPRTTYSSSRILAPIPAHTYVTITVPTHESFGDVYDKKNFTVYIHLDNESDLTGSSITVSRVLLD